MQKAWQSTTPMVMRWRMINWLIDVQDDANNYRLDVVTQTLPQANVRSANQLADFWINRILGRPMSDTDRTQNCLVHGPGNQPRYCPAAG
ncbi:MAG: DUF1800 domain-containing protein [Anaerolineae bacterium]|nr:DUF1800 domain-containing protein [Anaerolineae bacterium]